MKLQVKVVPGASSSAVVGWLGETLKIRVSAPADKGRANKAVESMISGILRLPGANVRIVAGKTSAYKVIEISGLSSAEVLQRIHENVA